MLAGWPDENRGHIHLGQLALEFGRRADDVERHRHRACSKDGEVADDEGGIIGRKDGDSVARLDPLVHQP